MIWKRLRKSFLFILLGTLFIRDCTLPAASNASVDSVPLTISMIENFWHNYPQTDPSLYVSEVVEKRRVAFLATKSVRTILNNNNVPLIVTNALPKRPASQEVFNFLVWKLDNLTSKISVVATKDLSNSIYTNLRRRNLELVDVFPYHQKGTLMRRPENLEKTGPPMEELTGHPKSTTMHVTGSVEADGQFVQIKIILTYVGQLENNPVIIDVEPVHNVTPTSDGLVDAGPRVFDAIHSALRKELLTP